MAKPFVYALSTCPHCRRTRRLLDELAIDYDVVEVDLLGDEERGRVIDEVRRISGGASFPVVIIGDRIVVGHNEEQLRTALARWTP
jgi:glutaredoxin